MKILDYIKKLLPFKVVSGLGIECLYKDNNINNYLETHLSNLKIINNKSYIESIFYYKDQQLIFELENNSQNLWVHNIVWDDLQNICDLTFEETRDIIQNYVEKNYKLYNIIPCKPL